MVVKVVATPCLQWSQPSVPHSSTGISFPSKKRALKEGVLLSRSAWFGTVSSNLNRTKSFEFIPKQRAHTIQRAHSASFDQFFESDEEFSRKIQELALQFQLSDDDNDEICTKSQPQLEYQLNSIEEQTETLIKKFQDPSMAESPDLTSSIEMTANSVDLRLSLRIIKQNNNKKKNQWQESAYCSIRKAFSSMVFIISELHRYSLQMRELLFYEDLRGILSTVREEIHASFVWLFQQVFFHTPTLMVYVMILLANFTVHSMSATAAVRPAPPSIFAAVEERESSKFDSPSTVKSFSISSPSPGKTTSAGGSNGGGNSANPVASGTDGDGWVNSLGNLDRPIVPDGVPPFTTREESVSGQDTTREDEEEGLWDKILKETSTMQGHVMDHGTLRRFVSPVTAMVEADDYEHYFRTQLIYQMGLAQEPNNVLLLANYAEFLYLVAHDYDRAEEYFKRATKIEPKDAEAHCKYANFLWQVRNDLWAAEETFLESISADPTNSFYAANYAHFLWNTGGEDTCFPLTPLEDNALGDA